MDMKQGQLFSHEIPAPGFARAPEHGTGLAWQGGDRQCRQSLPVRCPYPHQSLHAVPSLQSCNCQVGALASGALDVPEHPAALGIPERPTAQGPGGSPRSGRSRDSFQPGASILLAFTGGKSPSGAGSRARLIVTHQGHAGWGPSVGHGWAVGTTGMAQGARLPCNPTLLPSFSVLLSQGGNQESQPDWENGPGGPSQSTH